METKMVNGKRDKNAFKSAYAPLVFVECVYLWQVWLGRGEFSGLATSLVLELVTFPPFCAVV